MNAEERAASTAERIRESHLEPGTGYLLVRDIITALRQARNDALEEAAGLCGVEAQKARLVAQADFDMGLAEEARVNRAWTVSSSSLARAIRALKDTDT